MKKWTISISYIVMLLGLLGIILFIMQMGKDTSQQFVPASVLNTRNNLTDTITQSFSHPLAIFILQLVIIITAAQLCGFAFKKMGQPPVMGEIIAGILLGPSLMGAVLPSFSAFLFPASSLNNLQMLSQVGLILFMFVVGMELDVNAVKRKIGATLFISNASILLPFCLGVLLAYLLYGTYAPAHIPFYAFALFMGIVMSITAFPVLARVIRERGLTGTRLGNTAITCAAIDDITAWCSLAFIIAIVKAGSVTASLYTLFAAGVYVVVMLFVVRPLLRKLTVRKIESKIVKQSTLAFIFVMLLLSAYGCEVIGIHALFGAFFAGISMPAESSFRKVITDKIKDVTLVLLLPLFFVFTGLRTQVGLLNNSALWFTCGWIILCAVTGKFGGGFIASRLAGESMKDSLSLGALMNTRGLVELVVLNIGYDLGILTPQMFTMMVLMAIITTLMTGPSLNIIERLYKNKALP